jgi:hypothetical protein
MEGPHFRQAYFRRRRPKLAPPRLVSPLVRAAAEVAAQATPAGGMSRAFARRMEKRRVEWGKNMKRVLANITDILREEMDRVIFDVTCELEQELVDFADYSAAKRKPRKAIRKNAAAEENPPCKRHKRHTAPAPTIKPRMSSDPTTAAVKHAAAVKHDPMPMSSSSSSSSSLTQSLLYDGDESESQEFSQEEKKGKSMPDWLD